MDFNSVLENRHSVKSFYNEGVSDEQIKRLLEAARLSPSWSNNQCWKFIVVDDLELKDNLAKKVPAKNPARKAIEEAPILILLCANPMLSGEIDMREYYMVDAGIAMEHLVLAAVNEGLGTCWVGEFHEDEVRHMLDIPKNYRVIAMTPVGVPGSHEDKHNKRDIMNIAYRNSWNTPVEYLH